MFGVEPCLRRELEDVFEERLEAIVEELRVRREMFVNVEFEGRQ
jgi:hypothetical protein